MKWPKINFIKWTLAASLVLASFLGGCLLPDRGRSENDTDIAGSSEQIDNNIELTLHFRNLSPGQETNGNALTPVHRFIPKTEALIRATVTELLRGPTLKEVRDYGVGPVVSGQVGLADVYVKEGICVLHLDFDEPLFSDLPLVPEEAERLFVQAIVSSLVSIPFVEAVWLLNRGGFWQGEYWHYYGPVAVREKGVAYKLYYRNNSYTNFSDPIWDYMITAIDYVPENQHPLSAYDGSPGGPFFEIIEKLTAGYSNEYGPTLPKGVIAEGFQLQDGVLTIALNGRAPASHQATQTMIHSLVYTFTGLPEIERIMVTLNGEPFTGGDFIWDIPLGREDLK